MPDFAYMGERPGRSSTSGAIEDGKEERVYLFKAPSRFHSGTQVIQWGVMQGILPIPLVSFLGDNLAMMCRTLNARQDKKSPRHWEVTANWASEKPDQNKRDEQLQPNPLARRAKFKWSSTRYQKAVYEDQDGHAIMNSAGDFFDPVPEVDRSRWTVTITKNVSGVPTWVIDYEDAVNNPACQVQGVYVPPRCGKIMSIEISDEQEENDVEFVVFSWTIEFRRETWDLLLLDQGLRELSGGELKPIKIGTPGRDVTSPVPLEAGTAFLDATPETANKLKFRVFPEKDFNALPLT